MISLRQVARSIVISSVTIAAIAPSGLAQNSTDINCNDLADKNHQTCTLDAQNQYSESMSKCQQDFPAGDDSCKQLMSQIHEQFVSDCNAKKVEEQNQCSQK
jgi:hypothetical protein